MREVDIEFKWEWKKDFESYMLILYFNCEGKDSHIRTERCYGTKQKHHTFSWGPRHDELGLIAHLLFYANILNGYKKSKKQSLRNKLIKNARAIFASLV